MYYFAGFVVIISVLMISNVKYRTIKKIKSKHSLLLLFFIGVIISLAINYKFIMIPALAALYLISPLIVYIFSKFKRKTTESPENPQL